MEMQEKSKMNELPTKILVSSLPSTVHEEYLEMFFENPKKSGGGPVVSVVYDEETASAIVEFEDPEVVENVLKKHPLKMMGQEISVEVFDPGPVTLCTIEVTGPHDLVCEEQMETLQLYFEHKRSLGDEVKDIVFDGDIALVTFFSEEVARRVAGKSNHKINKKPISVKLHSTESNKLRDDREGFARGEDETVDKNEEAENERALTVKVKGVKELPSKDAVENYIDNKRRSGGSGLQKNISYEDDDVLYVKYQSEEGLKMTENLYNIKKVGNHWLLGKADKSLKRISVLTHVTKVQLSDNFLIADDNIIYKIQEHRDDIVLIKIDDICVHEEQQKNEAEHFCKEKTDSFKHGNGAVEKPHEEDTLPMKSDNTRLKEKQPVKSNSTFDDFHIREQNGFSETPKKPLLDQSENRYSSLEVGQTEDSSLIETIYFNTKSGNCTEHADKLVSTVTSSGQKETETQAKQILKERDMTDDASSEADIKTPTRVVPPTSRSACITVSNVRVNARIASTKSCRNSEAIIYFWDISKLYSVTKEDKFLKETAIGQEFFKKRNSSTGPFVTGAGAFGSGKILHIPLKNAGDCLLEGFIESILFADKEGCSSATFLFKLQSPFVIYQEKLSEALIAAVQDMAEKLKDLKHITLDFEEGLNAEKLFQPFRRDNKNKEKGLTGMPLAGKENHVKSLGRYILVSNIPGGYSFASLSERLLRPGLPVGFKRLIYLDGSKDALIICFTSEDAYKLSGCCEVKPFTFQCIEKQSLGPFDCCIRKSEVEKMQRDGNVSKFKKALKELNVDVSGSEELKVVAATRCQMSWALRLKQEYCSDEKRNMTSSDEYVHIQKISDVKEEIWKIMQVKKEKEMQQFEEELGNLNFCGNVIIATLKEENNKATFMKLMDEFKSFVEDFRKLEFQTVDIEAQYVNNIESWMKETEENMGKSCCTYIPGDKKVIAYSDSYEEVKKVERHFLIKQKIIKPTGRRRKVTHDKQSTSGPTSLQGYFSAELGETDSCSMNRIADFEWEKDAKNVKVYKTNEGIQVYVYVADILKLPVDCIVNAANNSLSHGGGVAKAIADGAGPALDKEGVSYIKSYGKIKVGHAMSTGAGRLPYKRVIHTVGPSWHFYNPHNNAENISRCENDLINAVYSSFLEAEKHHLKKIALPTISAAIFAVPKDLCVCMYVKATLKYSRDRTPSPLSEIHFVDKDPRIIAMIQEEFNCVLKKGEDSPYVKKSKRQGRWSESQKSGQEDLLSENKILIISPEYALLDGIRNVFYFCGNIDKKLLVYKGDLLCVRNAAVVATIGDKHNKGRIAQTIAGRIPYHQKDAYRKELEKKVHPSCSPGTLIMTEGYGSGFDKIFHVVFPPNVRLKETTYRRKDLHEAFCNIFTKALSERDIGTISTTLIGIDDSKQEEVDMCCDVFLEEYVSIAKDKLLQRVKPFDVHLVLQTGNNARRVTAKFKEFVDRQRQYFQAMSSMANEGQNTRYQKPKASSSDGMEMDKCVICLDTMTNAETLKCGHRYCKECIEQHFKVKKTCPSCGAVCGVITAAFLESRKSSKGVQLKSAEKVLKA